jgi:hypothetical protein
VDDPNEVRIGRERGVEALATNALSRVATLATLSRKRERGTPAH